MKIIYVIIEFYLEYVKNICNSTIKRQITQLKNGQRIQTDISPEKINK